MALCALVEAVGPLAVGVSVALALDAAVGADVAEVAAAHVGLEAGAAHAALRAHGRAAALRAPVARAALAAVPRRQVAAHLGHGGRNASLTDLNFSSLRVLRREIW